MKIKRLVGLLSELTPHAYSDDVVLMWLSNCENSILTDVFLLSPAETVEYEAVTEDKLLVPHPYDKLYLPYLQAQVAHANQEYDLYANLMAMYNAYRYEYAQYIVNGADPGSGDAVARGYFLSAYGVAVAHGYAGSEEEWIASLKGATGAPGEPGMSAYEEAREQGFEGTEEEWLASLKGENGLSAYEVALEQGFEGTASEWLESIKGPAGRSTVLAYAPEDGQSYTAQAEGVVAEQGCEIVLVPQSTNQGAATLALNGGTAYPLCLRPGWNVTGDDLHPQLTLPLEAGMLLRGGEYIFRFDGAAWVLQSYISDPKAEEARLLAEDAEQTAITAISMGNHIIRAETSDGVSYVAPKSDTLPAIATGTAGGHTGKGTRIVLIPSWPNTAESPTLKIGDGEVIPIRLRSAANKGDNDQVPDATDDIPVGALMAGVPYAMTFCGKYWLVDSLIGGTGGGRVSVQDEEPENAQEGDVWIDTDEEPEEADTVTAEELEEALSIAAQEQKAYVDEAIAQAGGSGGAAATDITDQVMEWTLGLDGNLSGALTMFYIAALVQMQYGPGRYIAFGGTAQFDVYYSEDLLQGQIRAQVQSSSVELSFATGSDEEVRHNGYVFYVDPYTNKREMLTIVADQPVAFGVTGLAEPTEDSGAANKKYVDDAIAAALDGIALAEEGVY